MTRKRFIKLLMSHGISRNKAVKIAAEYNSQNIPYDTAYARETHPVCVNLNFNTEGLCKGIAAAAAAFRDFASTAKKAAEKAAKLSVMRGAISG